MTSARTLLEKAAEAINEIRDELVAKILALPDNPNIIRSEDAESTSFTISSKNLRDNWSPQYHDFVFQYECVANHIMKKEAALCLATLKTMVEGEAFVTGWETPRVMRMHPEVVKHLKGVLDEATA